VGAAGRDAATLQAFFAELGEHGRLCCAGTVIDLPR
jgi:hypothetical protein